MRTIEEKMSTVRQYPIKISKDFFESLSEGADTLSAELVTACKAYEKDLTDRKKNLDAQASEARESIKRLEAEKDALKSAITDAASRTDLDHAAKLEVNLDTVEKELSILRRKVRLADSTELKGDPVLFAAAEKRAKAMGDADKQRCAAYSECYELLKPVIEERTKLLDLLLSKASRRWRLDGDSEFQRVCAHFTEEEKRKAEADAASRALQEQQALHHKNLETGHWIGGI